MQFSMTGRKSLSLWITFSFFFCIKTNRILHTVVNPDFPSGLELNETVNLVYTTSTGTEDIVHHLWSTLGKGAPSLLIALTPLNTNLTVNWTLLLEEQSGAIHFSDKPSYAFGLVLTKLIEYNDPDDKGNMNGDQGIINIFDLARDFKWDNISNTENTDSNQKSSATFRTELNCSAAFVEDGFIALEFETQGNDGRSEIIPRLLFSANSTQLRVILNKAQSTYDTSRFAVELEIFTSLISSTSKTIPFHLDTIKTMDDEYTPGVFKTIHILSNGRKDPNSGGYMSWKPVAYTTDELTVTGSTNAVNYEFNDTTADIPFSVATSFFNDNIFEDFGALKFDVSFGMTKDDFYTSTNYTEWTLSCGLGVPGKEELSSLVKIVIASGLGLPALLMIASGVYLCYHKYKVQKDDLLLSHR